MKKPIVIKNPPKHIIEAIEAIKMNQKKTSEEVRKLLIERGIIHDVS